MAELALPESWTRGSCMVLTRAEVLGPFACHETRGSRGYTLTLASSGHAIVQEWPSLSSVQELAEELLRMPIDWGQPTKVAQLVLMGPLLDDVRKAVREIGAKYKVEPVQECLNA